MAAVLEVLLGGNITPQTVVRWMKKPNQTENLPETLKDTCISKLHQEFVPFFLNYLRDQTLHLLHSTKSATPSPVKTPLSEKVKKTVSTANKHDHRSKRVQLFSASPGDILDDIKATSGSMFSPNTSVESPYLNNSRNSTNSSFNEKSGRYKGNKGCNNQKTTPGGSQRQSPQYGNKPGHDHHRSKHKFSLGEFLTTPENYVSPNQRKKNSPYSSGRRDAPFENSPSPSPSVTRRSGGKKRHSLPKYDPKNSSPTSGPVFSLSNASDFPAIGDCGKPLSPRDMNISEKGDNLSLHDILCIKNSPVFEMTPKPSKPANITKSRRISFTTLPQDGAGDSAQSPSRRIKPTPIQVDILGPTNKAFTDTSTTDVGMVTNKQLSDGGVLVENTEDLQKHLVEERELLKQERAKRQQESLHDCPGLATPTKTALERINSVVEMAVAERSEVTHGEQLNVLAEMYSLCLGENLFPNLAVELYFLMQLLTCRSSDVELISDFVVDAIDTNYFSTVHNAVYFAVKVLEQQIGLLDYLDKSTLKLLSENTRVVSFSPQLTDWLLRTYEKQVLLNGPALPKSPIGGVSFQAETDNRKNFPSDQSFHMFKKQRDAFYELLREWEADHMTPSWSLSDVMGLRIRSLVNNKMELTNCVHFARLFQSQLITMCKGDGSIRTEGDDESIAFLSQLKRSNPEKFKRLQERFIKPSSIGGPCPSSSFPGYQEFFHDFIISASSPLFNQHLTDTFAAKVSELNTASIVPCEMENSEVDHGESDDDEKTLFSANLLTLRLLGKFMGFVTFLPYQTTAKLPEDTLAAFISLRKNQVLHLDIGECLKTAFYLGRLTLTVPWIVEFLNMMDVIAPNLDYFQTVLFILLYIHRYIWEEKSEPYYSKLLIVTTISWLFENTVIPEGFYFMDIPDEVASMMLQNSKCKLEQSVDMMGFVDQGLYYSCCQYIGEMKTLLIEFAVGSSSKNATIRKITPVSADDSSTPSVSEKQVQLQLEENFFHNHPSSLKRTVEFVAERTASNFIKNFRATMLQESFKDCKTKLSTHLKSMSGGSPSGKAKDKLQLDIFKISQEMVTQVKSKALSDVDSYCKRKIEASLQLLLPDEQSEAVVAMASEISMRLASERVHLWMNKYITTSMFQNELQTELDRLLKNLFVMQQKQDDGEHSEPITLQITDVCCTIIAKKHSYDFRHPSEVLIDLKDMVKDIVVKNISPSKEKVKTMLTEVKNNLHNRQDIIPSVMKGFGNLMRDLPVLLLSCFPEEWDESLIDDFVTIWKNELREVVSFYAILCGHVVLRLEESNNVQVAWEKYTRFVIRVIEEKLLTNEELQKSCLCVLQNYEECLKHLGPFICHLVEHFMDHQEIHLDLTESLEWIFQLSGESSTTAFRVLNILGKADTESNKLQILKDSNGTQTVDNVIDIKLSNLETVVEDICKENIECG